MGVHDGPEYAQLTGGEGISVIEFMQLSYL
jgi:hypothetical protein